MLCIGVATCVTLALCLPAQETRTHSTHTAHTRHTHSTHSAHTQHTHAPHRHTTRTHNNNTQHTHTRVPQTHKHSALDSHGWCCQQGLDGSLGQRVVQLRGNEVLVCGLECEWHEGRVDHDVVSRLERARTNTSSCADTAKHVLIRKPTDMCRNLLTHMHMHMHMFATPLKPFNMGYMGSPWHDCAHTHRLPIAQCGCAGPRANNAPGPV